MMYAHVNKDYIAIMQDNTADEQEIVGWSKDEWLEDPELVVPAIANAIMLCYENPVGLLEILNNVGSLRK